MTIPDDYRWPGARVVSGTETAYWINEHDGQDGVTTLYMVIGVDGDGQHIVAERCYLRWAIRIVDGLRAFDALEHV